jgi:hypothetical protein
VAKWSLVWAHRWVAWVHQAVPLLALRVAVNLHPGVRNLVAALRADKAAQADPQVAVKQPALAVLKAVQHLALEVPVGLVGPAVRKLADLAVPKVVALVALRAVAKAVRAGKAVLVALRWPNLVLQCPCAVASRQEQPRPQRDLMV